MEMFFFDLNCLLLFRVAQLVLRLTFRVLLHERRSKLPVKDGVFLGLSLRRLSIPVFFNTTILSLQI